MSKGSRQRYYERKGFIKPKEVSASFTRSENGNRYEYPNRIANKFAGWSSVQRDAGKTPLFKDFYNELQQEDQALINITEIFKDNETEKANCG